MDLPEGRPPAINATPRGGLARLPQVPTNAAADRGRPRPARGAFCCNPPFSEWQRPAARHRCAPGLLPPHPRMPLVGEYRRDRGYVGQPAAAEAGPPQPGFTMRPSGEAQRCGGRSTGRPTTHQLQSGDHMPHPAKHSGRCLRRNSAGQELLIQLLPVLICARRGALTLDKLSAMVWPLWAAGWLRCAAAQAPPPDCEGGSRDMTDMVDRKIGTARVADGHGDRLEVVVGRPRRVHRRSALALAWPSPSASPREDAVQPGSAAARL